MGVAQDDPPWTLPRPGVSALTSHLKIYPRIPLHIFPRRPTYRHRGRYRARCLSESSDADQQVIPVGVLPLQLQEFRQVPTVTAAIYNAGHLEVLAGPSARARWVKSSGGKGFGRNVYKFASPNLLVKAAVEFCHLPSSILASKMSLLWPSSFFHLIVVGQCPST